MIKFEKYVLNFSIIIGVVKCLPLMQKHKMHAKLNKCFDVAAKVE